MTYVWHTQHTYTCIPNDKCACVWCVYWGFVLPYSYWHHLNGFIYLFRRHFRLISSMLHRIQYIHTHTNARTVRLTWIAYVLVGLFVFIHVRVCLFLVELYLRNRCGGWRIDDRHAEMMMYVKEISVDGSRIKNDVKCKSEWQHWARRR